VCIKTDSNIAHVAVSVIEICCTCCTCTSIYEYFEKRSEYVALLLTAACDVTAVHQSTGGLRSLEAFEASLQEKVEIKTT